MPDRSVREEIDIDEIDFGERGRKVYTGIEELATDIERVGELINPITVMQNKHPTIIGKYLLIAGGRRIKACQHLGKTTISANIWPADTTELELRRIELMENMARVDLSWQEEVTMLKQLKELEKKLSDVHVSDASIARTIGKDPSQTTKSLRLADALIHMPAIAKCKTKSDANKVLVAAKEAVLVAEQARRVKAHAEDKGAVIQRMLENYYLVDFFDYAKTLPLGQFDHIELDPDYGINFPELLMRRGEPFHAPSHDRYREVVEEAFPEFMNLLFKTCFPLLKRDAWITCWCAITKLHLVYMAAIEAGFTGQMTPMIWTKHNIGRTTNPSISCCVDYEVCLYMRKGQAQLVHQAPSSLLESTRGLKTHPAEKPIDLLKKMLGRFIGPGSNVLVPFAGSGNTLMAVHELGGEARGCDLVQAYKDSYVLKVAKGWRPERREVL